MTKILSIKEKEKNKRLYRTYGITLEEWNELSKNGFKVEVAYGCDEAIKIVENYLKV